MLLRAAASSGTPGPSPNTWMRHGAALVTRHAHRAELGCLNAFGTTDFREDLTKINVPTLVIHGDSDAVVPFEGSGKRTHEAVAGSELVVVAGGPHGFNVSHAGELNEALIAFLAK